MSSQVSEHRCMKTQFVPMNDPCATLPAKEKKAYKEVTRDQPKSGNTFEAKIKRNSKSEVFK